MYSLCLLLHILLLALYTLHVDSTVLQRKKQVGGTGRQAFSIMFSGSGTPSVGSGMSNSVGFRLSGIITRPHLCWNFGGLVPEALSCYRYQPKTPGSYHLGAFFWHKMSSKFARPSGVLDPQQELFASKSPKIRIS